MRKIRCLCLLAVLMLVISAALTACQVGKTPAESNRMTDTEGTPVSESPTEEETRDPLAPDFDPTELDYEEQEIRILQCEYLKAEFLPLQGGTGDLLEQNLFARNAQVEADLNIRFAFPTVQSDMHSPGKLLTAVEMSVKAGDPKTMYHIVAQPSYYVTAIMMAGHYRDLGGIENSYINLEKQYWLPSYVDASVINEKYYFVTGMACTSILDRMEVVYVNNKLANDYYPGSDIRQTVYDGNWTYEKMLEMIAEAGDGSSTGIYGMAMPVNSNSIDGMLCAMKLDMLTMNSSGIPTANVNTQHNTDIIEKLRDLYYHNESVTTGDPIKAFSENRAIFCMTLMKNTSKLYNAGINYTLIPMPKYDAAQSDYVVAAHDEYSILSICRGVENEQMLTAVLEDLAYRSVGTTYHATYVKTYSQRYAGNPENQKMFDYLFEHLNFSAGYIYSHVLGDCKNTPRYLLYPTTVTGIPVNVNSGVGSSFAALEETVETELEDFIEFFFGKP